GVRIANLSGRAGDLSDRGEPPRHGEEETIAPAAVLAIPPIPSMPAHSRALSRFPSGHATPESVDDSGDFVSWNSRVLNARPESFFHVGVGVADTAGFHSDSHPTGPGLGYVSLHDLKRTLRLGHLHSTHFGHISSNWPPVR